MSDQQDAGMFREPAAEKSFPATAVAIAAVAIAVLVVVLVVLGRKPASSLGANAAAYAPNLMLSEVQMSEAASISGGKSTYVDGKITNQGPATVTAVSVSVSFPNDQAMPPQTMTAPLNLIRMKEPYVDVAPVSAAPIAPGATAEFRLIFEDVNDNWNLQTPSIRVAQVATR